MAPKTRTCYICGRLTLLPGFESHVAKCRQIYEMREAAKPPKERRPCPQDPILLMKKQQQMQQMQNIPSLKPSFSSSSYNNNSSLSRPIKSSSNSNSGFSLRDIELATAKQFEDQVLVRCRFCHRTFLPDRLSKHNKACTASNPFPPPGEINSPISSKKKFNSFKQRVHGTALEDYYPPSAIVSGKPSQTKPMALTIHADELINKNNSRLRKSTNWVHESLAFRNAIRTAKQMAIASKSSSSYGDSYGSPTSISSFRHSLDSLPSIKSRNSSSTFSSPTRSYNSAKSSPVRGFSSTSSLASHRGTQSRSSSRGGSRPPSTFGSGGRHSYIKESQPGYRNPLLESPGSFSRGGTGLVGSSTRPISPSLKESPDNPMVYRG